MTRIPPALSYLTIYNPTLRPSSGVTDEDEDVEAQAHILFYTSKEKAVSRDRMLRQVGLAKALVNFTESFNDQDPCDSVRSQARRMIMISPEPDFWIHAGIDIAKSLRPPVGNSKGKVKEKGKAALKSTDNSLPLYEYHDQSVQDEAIRVILFRGYEQFKLLHGSFTQILSDLGQEALELQLERFFTVWAWSLSLEETPDFGVHIGVPLHPAYRKIVKLLDLIDEVGDSVSMYAQQPHAVPSSNYSTNGYPSSLLRHALTLVPRPKTIPDSSLCHDLPTNTPERNVVPSEQAQKVTFQQGINLDNRKWYWPPYLTFGGKETPKSDHAVEVLPEVIEKQDDTKGVSPQLSDVDTKALEDAMNTVTVPTFSHSENVALAQAVSDSSARVKSEGQADLLQYSEANAVSSSKPAPTMQTTFIHLPEPTNPLLTKRRPVHYFIVDERLLTVVPPGEDVFQSGEELAKKAAAFFRNLEQISQDDSLLSSSDHLPSAAKILQPLDHHVVLKEGLTCSEPLFSSRSNCLYETQATLDSDLEIQEVFSRGQNPQHWHAAKRGIGVASDKPSSDQGEVYLEVFRKESSLADVDNVLSGIVRNQTKL